MAPTALVVAHLSNIGALVAVQVVESDGGSEHLPRTVVAADGSPTPGLVVATVDEIIDIGKQSVACVATCMDGFYKDGIGGC